MTPDLVCGLDPGVTGGISILDSNGAVVGSWPTPETEHEVAELLCEFAPRIARAFVERVQPMPTGSIAMFKLGRSYGLLRGILTVLQIPFDEVRPQVWQQALGCMTKGKKAVSRQKAQQLFPGCPVRITDKIADSLLIAEYGRRHLG
jgi:hypothetical protein